MGLDIRVVSSDFHYDKELEEYVGETLCDLDAHIGYIGYKVLRDEIFKFFSNNDLTGDSLFVPTSNGGIFKNLEPLEVIKRSLKGIGDSYDMCYAWIDDDTLTPYMSLDEFNEEITQEKEKSVNMYFEKLDALKRNYPKVYILYPFLSHSDCEGSLSYEHCERVIDLLKEFRDNNDTIKNENLIAFMGVLIELMEQAIKLKGKLWFC